MESKTCPSGETEGKETQLDHHQDKEGGSGKPIEGVVAKKTRAERNAEFRAKMMPRFWKVWNESKPILDYSDRTEDVYSDKFPVDFVKPDVFAGFEPEYNAKEGTFNASFAYRWVYGYLKVMDSEDLLLDKACRHLVLEMYRQVAKRGEQLPSRYLFIRRAKENRSKAKELYQMNLITQDHYRGVMRGCYAIEDNRVYRIKDEQGNKIKVLVYEIALAVLLAPTVMAANPLVDDPHCPAFVQSIFYAYVLATLLILSVFLLIFHKYKVFSRPHESVRGLEKHLNTMSPKKRWGDVWLAHAASNKIKYGPDSSAYRTCLRNALFKSSDEEIQIRFDHLFFHDVASILSYQKKTYDDGFESTLCRIIKLTEVLKT